MTTIIAVLAAVLFGGVSAAPKPAPIHFEFAARQMCATSVQTANNWQSCKLAYSYPNIQKLEAARVQTEAQ